MRESDYESEDEDFDPKATRKKRMANRRKHSRGGGDKEQRLRAPKNTRPRVKTLKWNPDFDEDDYEEFYE
jgi:hypothetical protein